MVWSVDRGFCVFLPGNGEVVQTSIRNARSSYFTGLAFVIRLSFGCLPLAGQQPIYGFRLVLDGFFSGQRLGRFRT